MGRSAQGFAHEVQTILAEEQLIIDKHARRPEYAALQELCGFYLDIIKDRQYTTGANSKARRSAQTALYHISEALAP